MQSGGWKWRHVHVCVCVCAPAATPVVNSLTKLKERQRSVRSDQVWRNDRAEVLDSEAKTSSASWSPASLGSPSHTHLGEPWRVSGSPPELHSLCSFPPSFYFVFPNTGQPSSSTLNQNMRRLRCLKYVTLWFSYFFFLTVAYIYRSHTLYFKVLTKTSHDLL